MAVILGRDGIVAEDVYDGLNTYGTRNFDDTEYDMYNCFGYAFQTFSWLHPILTGGAVDNYVYNEGDWSLFDKDAEKRIDNGDAFPLEVEEMEMDNLRDEFGKDYLENNFDQWDYTQGQVIKIMIDHILKNFSDVRIIKNESELYKGEYAIYMCGCPYDFHFCVYDPITKMYFHKRGATDPEEVASPAEAFGLKYFGKVTCFAKSGAFTGQV